MIREIAHGFARIRLIFTDMKEERCRIQDSRFRIQNDWIVVIVEKYHFDIVIKVLDSPFYPALIRFVGAGFVNIQEGVWQL